MNMKHNQIQNTVWALTFGAVLSLTSAGCGAGEAVRIGYSLEFESEILVNEMKVALKFILEKVLKEQGLDAVFTFPMKESENQLAAAEGKVDMFDMSVLRFALLPEEERAKMRPIIVPQHRDRKLTRFVLLAPPGTKIESLRGKRLRRIAKRDRRMASAWLTSVLWKDCGATLEDYFGDITDWDDASEVVVPTFFGKADCCLVAWAEFELLAELNPQISRRLEVVRESPELLTTLLLLREGFDGVEEDRAVRIAETLHEGKDGEQAFTLMRIKRLRKFREEEMEGVNAIAKVLREIEAEKAGKVEIATKENWE